MEMHQVRYFLAVARTLNFTRAAEESNVTQPSLTRAIQKLEDEFGGLLFRRERSLTHLTDLGRQMLPHLERTYEAAQAAKNLARGIGKVALAPLNLGLSAALDLPPLTAAFAEVGAGLPGLDLRIASGDAGLLLDEILKGDLDMVLVVEPRTVHERLDVVPLFDLTYRVAVPADHPLTADAAPSLAALSGAAWIAAAGDVETEFQEACEAAAMRVEPRHRTSSEADSLRLVAAGLGMTLTADGTTLPDRVRRLDIAGLSLSRRVVIATVSGRQRPPAGEALLRAIRARAWP